MGVSLSIFSLITDISLSLAFPVYRTEPLHFIERGVAVGVLLKDKGPAID